MGPSLILKLEKWAIWAALIGILFLLRHLFPIFFVTFVLSWIANTAVNAMTRRYPRRKVNVVVVYVVFLAILGGALFLIVPRMIAEARVLARQYIATEAEAEGKTTASFAKSVMPRMMRGIAVVIAASLRFTTAL